MADPIRSEVIGAPDLVKAGRPPEFDPLPGERDSFETQVHAEG